MPSPNPHYNIAVIPGDGIGPEVIGAAITVLQKLASTLGTFSLQCDHLPWSSEYYKAHGRYIPEGGLEELGKYDAILFGSVGDPGSALPNMHSTEPLLTFPTCRCTRSHISHRPPPNHHPPPQPLRQPPSHPPPSRLHFSSHYGLR